MFTQRRTPPYTVEIGTLPKAPLIFPLAVILVFSGAVNILTLSSSLYMLQVFDRVLAGRSWSTLVYLTLITLAALAALGILDSIRAQLLNRLAEWGER
ncbi:MAG: type I secretion system permease/ATPase, partial [Hyphomicrobiales bacterium]